MDDSSKKAVRSYVDDNMYEDLKEMSYVLNMSMSKIIAKCLLQGLEVMRAEAMNQEPRVVIRDLREYLKEKEQNNKSE